MAAIEKGIPLGEIPEGGEMDTIVDAKSEGTSNTQAVRWVRLISLGLVLSILGPEFVADAEDVTQDVFLQVYRHLPGFRGESSFGTWLYSIARNKAIDRKRQARFRLPHITQDELSAPVVSEQKESPHGVLAKSEQQKLVQDCIERLPYPYRSSLYLYYWMKYSVSEIAELLNMRPGSVRSHLHRARKMLHRLLVRKGMSHASGL
jgi:RNA polymerase sigma-70 factor (ECF subfamily)